jgi:hypothetical protein
MDQKVEGLIFLMHLPFSYFLAVQAKPDHMHMNGFDTCPGGFLSQMH